MTTSRNWLKDFSQKHQGIKLLSPEIYSEWARASRTTPNHIEMSLLTDNRDALCEELCKFVVETQYSPRGIQLILCGLQRYIRQEWPHSPVNFMSHCHLRTPQPSLETDPIEELKGIDSNVLFAFELYK